MDVYKTKSVYKAPGVYKTPGIYKDSSEVVLLNGVRYENRFYEIDSNNVGSTFVDAVQLPEGYEKLGRVWYDGTYDNDYPSLLETDFELPLQFGNIYSGFNLVSISVNSWRLFTTQPVFSSTIKRTSYFCRQSSISVSRSSVWNSESKDGTFGKSVQMSDENKIKEDLLAGTWRTLSSQVGSEPTSRAISLLSSRGLCYLRFFFVADRNRQVTFTAIPCKHGNDYGLYDAVAGKFYTHANLTGD